MSGGKFKGLYRGTVVDNLDPEQRGRLKIEVPDVLSLVPSTWAEPCALLSGPPGPGMGVYAVPPIGAGVWLQFEGGDQNYPVWVGCRFDDEDSVPSEAGDGLPVSPSIVLKTLAQNSIVISDVPGEGGITLTVGETSIAITLEGITITAPKLEIKAANIKLTGVTDINDGALKVT